MGRSKIIGKNKLKKHVFLSKIAIFNLFLQGFFSPAVSPSSPHLHQRAALGVAPEKNQNISFAVFFCVKISMRDSKCTELNGREHTGIQPADVQQGPAHRGMQEKQEGRRIHFH